MKRASKKDRDEIRDKMQKAIEQMMAAVLPAQIQKPVTIVSSSAMN
jgi:hypothetical protein